MADFWSGLGTVTNAPATDPAVAAQISQLFADAGRPPPTDAEIAANAGNPGGLPAVKALLASDNAAAGFNQPAAATGTQFGAAPSPYAVDPTAAATLAQNYSAPQFTTPAPTFTAPTVADVANDPFVQYGEQRAIRAQQNSAAAKGTVLNAQTTAALGRDVQDYSGSQTNNVFARSNQSFQDNLATYGANYNVFQGNAALSASADAANKTAAQATIGNAKDAYTTNFNANETAQTDYWNRLTGVANTGAGAAAA